MPPEPVTGVLLAAGAGRRLGSPKADVLLGGRRLVDRAADLLLAGGCDDVLAVLRPGAAAPPNARAVVNPDPDAGMGSSLRCAVDELAGSGRACVVLLVDLVGVQPGDVAAVIAAHRGGAGIVVTRRQGRQSHPVLVAARWQHELAAAAAGDTGGRAFFAAHTADTAFCDAAAIFDIDTPADLARARAELND